eukprot:TRINITY_DN40168_c0_g1_i1.p1 TRINITY_DN40168_c0_g1~~TRINITY_DN40168_c0_g1_i1.p1  ORF type:complete len:450 (-),score=110.82 TRINITY_DN40168_c0_g1_i1:23-1345(-)
MSARPAAASAVRGLLCVLLGLVWTSHCVTAAPASASSKASEASPESKQQRVRETCAPELGLVKEEETASSWTRNFRKFCNSSSPFAEKNLGVREVLGFVAPWTDHGHRAARYFRGKLSSVSPLWFRVLPGRAENQLFELAGKELAKEHSAWAQQLSAGSGPNVLPHLSLEGFDKLEGLRAVLESPDVLAEEVSQLCEAMQFSGVVFDVRLALFPSLRKLLPGLAAALSQRLRPAGRRFLLSVPADKPGTKPSFDRAEAAAVSKFVDGVVVSTRDFSKTEPGPSAPLPWVRSCLLRLMATHSSADGEGLRAEQLLLEVPLYGRAFAWGSDASEAESEGKVILPLELAKAVSKQKPRLVWDAEAAEHSANLTKSKVFASLPSLAFVEARLRLARSLGVGVALRELGSGFDAAFDLLTSRSSPVARSKADDALTDPALGAEEL